MVCTNQAFCQNEPVKNKQFSMQEIGQIKQWIDSTKYHSAFIKIDAVNQIALKNFYASHGISDKVAEKLNTLVHAVFDESISLKNRIKISEYLQMIYSENRDFFPVEVLANYNVVLSQKINGR
jgi:hypothetical protein